MVQSSKQSWWLCWKWGSRPMSNCKLKKWIGQPFVCWRMPRRTTTDPLAFVETPCCRCDSLKNRQSQSNLRKSSTPWVPHRSVSTDTGLKSISSRGFLFFWDRPKVATSVHPSETGIWKSCYNLNLTPKPLAFWHIYLLAKGVYIVHPIFLIEIYDHINRDSPEFFQHFGGP